MRVTSTGRPMTGVKAAVAKNLSLKVSYMDMQGKAMSPDKLKQGTDFIVQVTVTNPGTFTSHLDQMALSY